MNFTSKIYLHLKSHRLYTVFDQRVVNSTNGDSDGQELVLYTDGEKLFARESKEFMGKFLLQDTQDTRLRVGDANNPHTHTFGTFGTIDTLQAVAGEGAHVGEFWFGPYTETKDAIYFALPETRDESEGYNLADWEYDQSVLCGNSLGRRNSLPPGAAWEGSELLSGRIFKLKKLEKS